MKIACPTCGLDQPMENLRCVRCYTVLLPHCTGACHACRKTCAEPKPRSTGMVGKSEVRLPR